MSKKANNSVILDKQQIPLSFEPNFSLHGLLLKNAGVFSKLNLVKMKKNKGKIFNLLKYSYTKIMNWEQLVGGSAFGSILTETIRYFVNKAKQRHLASDSLNKLNEIYSKCMKLVLDETPADRFLIFRAEDGGGKIVPGVQLFASVLYEDYRHPGVNLGYAKPVIDKYQRWLCDKFYIEMLMQLCVKGSIKFDCKDLPTESRFKDVLEAEGIQYAEMHFIAQRSDKLFYCLISCTEPNITFDTPNNRNNIDISVNRLRLIFKQAVKNL